MCAFSLRRSTLGRAYLGVLMNNLLARRPRRLISVATVMAVAAGITVPLLFSGGANAATVTSVKLTDPIAVQPVSSRGQTFASGTATVTVPADASNITAVLAASPDGAQNAYVDDGVTLNVNGTGAQTTEFHNAACNTATAGKPAVAGLIPGTNTINWSLHDTCGGNGWSTALYVVVSYTVSVPTQLDAHAEAADLLKRGEPLGVHLFTLVARLTTISTGAPVPGQTILFKSGSFSCTGRTDADGFASCGGLPNVLNELPNFTAYFAGGGGYLPSSDSGGLIAVG